MYPTDIHMSAHVLKRNGHIASQTVLVLISSGVQVITETDVGLYWPYINAACSEASNLVCAAAAIGDHR